MKTYAGCEYLRRYLLRRLRQNFSLRFRRGVSVFKSKSSRIMAIFGTTFSSEIKPNLQLQLQNIKTKKISKSFYRTLF